MDTLTGTRVPLSALDAYPDLTATEFGDFLLSRDVFEPALVEAIATILAEKVIPTSWEIGSEDPYDAQLLLLAFSLRADLTAKAVETVVLSILEIMVREDRALLAAEWNNYLRPVPSTPLYQRMNDFVARAVVRLVEMPVADASLIGTAWRTVVESGRVASTVHSNLVCYGWDRFERAVFQAKQTPVEVSARMISTGSVVEVADDNFDMGIEPPADLVLTDAWLEQAVERFPDLDSLPASMAHSIIETLPVPDAWFVNKIPGLRGVKWVAPGMNQMERR